MTPCGYKPPSAFSSFIPSAQLSFFTTNPFQYNRPLDLSLINHHTPQGAHPNIVILLRMEDKAFSKNTCSGPAASQSNSSLPERFIT